jgi:hypothetical protein
MELVRRCGCEVRCAVLETESAERADMLPGEEFEGTGQTVLQDQRGHALAIATANRFVEVILPHDVEDDRLVCCVVVVAVGIPVGRTQVELDVTLMEFSPDVEQRASKIRAAAMRPDPAIDDPDHSVLSCRQNAAQPLGLPDFGQEEFVEPHAAPR